MDVDDGLHRVAIREIDVVEEASTQECVGQFLLVVRGDHDDRPLHGLDRLARLVDEELHAIEFLKEVIREFDVGLVDLVDEQYAPLLGGERLPKLALLDVIADVVDPIVAELRITQARNRVVLIQALLRLRRRLDVPGDQRHPHRAGDFLGKQGLSRTGFTLDQERPLKLHDGVYGEGEFICDDVGIGALEFHEWAFLTGDRMRRPRRRHGLAEGEAR